MAALATALCFVLYFLGYFFYARFLARRVFVLDEQATTPAHEFEDGVDYVPTKPPILFGHHWASITGLSPMLGPAVAVICRHCYGSSLAPYSSVACTTSVRSSSA